MLSKKNIKVGKIKFLILKIFFILKFNNLIAYNLPKSENIV